MVKRKDIPIFNMNINKILDGIINEQSILKTTKTKPIVDAITYRNPISFMYIGPRKPKKDSVKPGKRIKVEAVALGLSKKGNLIIRGYVQPPSVSKRGFEKHGWRTFMVSRMSNIEIHQDETFNTKRPEYKSGEDNSMTVTYVTTDWDSQPKRKRISKPAIKPEKPTQTTTKPIISKEKPTEPKTTKIEPEVKPIEPPTPEVKPQKELPPIPQKEKPTPPEEMKPEEPENNQNQVNEPENDEENELQETLKRFKSLIFY